MDKRTLENIFIFAIAYCNTHNGNKGHVYPSYINEKSRKYLGFNITEYEYISIKDFGNKVPNCSTIYKPALPHDIIDRIKNKIDLSIIRNYENVLRVQTDIPSYNPIRIIGLDSENTQTFIDMFETLDEEYIKRTLREANSFLLLDE